MILTAGTVFFLIAFAVAFAAVLHHPPPPDVSQAMLAFALPAYASFLYLDLRSTASHGRDAVGKRETAQPFRRVTRRWGFAASVPMQVFLEAMLAVFLIPLYFVWSLDAALTAVSLSAFAACHCIGWTRNRADGRA